MGKIILKKIQKLSEYDTINTINNNPILLFIENWILSSLNNQSMIFKLSPLDLLTSLGAWISESDDECTCFHVSISREA